MLNLCLRYWLVFTKTVTVSSTRNQSLSAAISADATVLPLRNAALIRGQLPEEPAVERLARWNISTNSESGPSSTEHHLTELYERPLQEATPRRGGVATYIHCKYRQTFCNSRLTTNSNNRNPASRELVRARLCLAPR